MRVNQDRLVNEFVKLVSIDSPSLDERAKADYLKSLLTALGFTVSEDTAGEMIGGNCGNIYAYLEGDSSLEPLLFSSHMDTVEPAKGKHAVLCTDGTIKSRGDTVLGADDNAGIASILEAVRVIREKHLSHRPIELLFTVCEEKHCLGAGAADYSKIRSKQAYVLDLSGPIGTAANQAPSIISYEITIRGKAAHAGFAPEQGAHTIRAAADAITKIPMGRLAEGGTLNIGVIQSGYATNIIPNLCKLEGEVRSNSHEKALELVKSVKQQFERSAAFFGCKAEFSHKVGCVAYETPLSHPVVKRFEAVCERLGLKTDIQPTFGGSDNNVFAQHGIEGLVIACGMYKCHSCEEYTHVNDLVKAAEVALLLMTEDMDRE